MFGAKAVALPSAVVKIAVLCHAGAGGSGVVATELGVLTAEAGNATHFVGSSLPFRLGRTTPNSLFFHEVGGYSYPLFEQPFPELAQANALADVITEHDLEVVHAHYAIPHASSALHARDILGRSKVVTTLHGTDVTIVGSAAAFRHSTRHAIQNCDRVTAVSHYLAAEARAVFDVDAPIDVIHNFVDSERFRRNNDAKARARYAHPDEAIFIHVSNFRPVKRVHDVIETFARVNSEFPSRLLMVGDGPERAGAYELAQELGISGRTQFLGLCPDLETMLSIADVFLLPSTTESFGLVALEAMSCEVPVVASKVGGLPEVVEDGVTGVLCAPKDVDAMADAALRIIGDNQIRTQMGAAGRQRALDHFRPEHIVPRYLDIYAELSGR